jgi:hypothetical protein
MFSQNQPDVPDDAQENGDPSANESVDDQEPDASPDTTEQDNAQTTGEEDEAPQTESDAEAEEPIPNQDSAPPSPTAEGNAEVSDLAIKMSLLETLRGSPRRFDHIS